MQEMVKRRDIGKLSYLDMDEFKVYFHNNHQEDHVIYAPELNDDDEVDQIVMEYETGVRISLDMIFLNIN